MYPSAGFHSGYILLLGEYRIIFYEGLCCWSLLVCMHCHHASFFQILVIVEASRKWGSERSRMLLLLVVAKLSMFTHCECPHHTNSENLSSVRLMDFVWCEVCEVCWISGILFLSSKSDVLNIRDENAVDNSETVFYNNFNVRWTWH